VGPPSKFTLKYFKIWPEEFQAERSGAPEGGWDPPQNSPTKSGAPEGGWDPPQNSKAERSGAKGGAIIFFRGNRWTKNDQRKLFMRNTTNIIWSLVKLNPYLYYSAHLSWGSLFGTQTGKD
jgi:hypothetical protein